jgi:hypothetical protein
MIATLPMYDWPEVREATDAWWAGLARHLRGAGFEAPTGSPGAATRAPSGAGPTSWCRRPAAFP